jgi:NAD(P)-dependent dehydrogenase (short-subunit alcohol dehydrogenase family)
MDHALLVITTLEHTAAVITGGASGIGRATAIALASTWR